MRIICALFFISSVMGCVQSNQAPDGGEKKVSPDIINNPATASESVDSAAVPEFSFAETRHHFGEITDGEKVSYSFRFSNTGKTDLVIASVRASCGCTVPEYSQEPVPPGGEGHIKVTFDSAGKPGMQSKTITVIANTVPATRVLTISAEVLPTQKPK